MVTARPIPDRRTERPDLPRCPRCESQDARVMSRTDYVVYVQCDGCHLLWSVPKPGVVQMGS